MRALHATVLVVVLLLAGCVEEESVSLTEPPSTSASGVDVDPFAKPAEWSRGRWWKYNVVGSFAGASAEPETLVVTEVGPDRYMVDTTSRSRAARDAEAPTDISYIGPIYRQHLSGQQETRRVDYFQFPLKVGATWSTVWDGQTRKMKAVSAEGDEFLVEASEGDRVRVRYTYHAKAGWFGRLDFLDAQGNPGYSMTLADYGDAFTGTYVRAIVKTLVSMAVKDQPVQQDNKAFKVDPGLGELVVRWDIHCAQQGGQWSFVVSPQDASAAQSQMFRMNAVCPGTAVGNQTIMSPKVGDWVADSKAVLVTGPNHLRLSILSRTFQDLSL